MAATSARPARCSTTARPAKPAQTTTPTRADALEHRDAPDLLQNEHAGDARHRDPAEDHDDEPDEAEIVLRPIEVAPDLIFVRAVRSRVGELLTQLLAQRRHQAIDPILR